MEDSPAYLSMLFAINAECNDSFKGRRCRPCLTLLDTIRSDLKRRKISNSLRSISDFENLRVIALDRVKWKSFEKCSFCFRIFFYFLRQLPIKYLGLLFFRYFVF